MTPVVARCIVIQWQYFSWTRDTGSGAGPDDTCSGAVVMKIGLGDTWNGCCAVAGDTCRGDGRTRDTCRGLSLVKLVVMKS